VIRGVYAQDNWKLNDKVKLTPGPLRRLQRLRQQREPPRRRVYQMNDALTWKLLYGKAYRAPTFNELYIRNNPCKGATRPDGAENRDGGAEQQLPPCAERHQFVSLYYNHYKDMILLDSTVVPFPTYYNSKALQETWRRVGSAVPAKALQVPGRERRLH